MEPTVNRIVNRVLKERPADPLLTIAQSLMNQSTGTKSYPTFEKLQARRVFLNDNTAAQSVRINVFLTYKGRTSLRYKHIVGYDNEEHDLLLFDNHEQKSGLNQGCGMISNEITETLRLNIQNEPLNLASLEKIDAILLSFYKQNLSRPESALGGDVASHEETKISDKGKPSSSHKVASETGMPDLSGKSPGYALIKGVSEAIYLATATCMAEGQVGNAIYENLHPNNVNSFNRPETKLMINLMAGGKAAGSAVRYSRFYLIIDPYANLEINIPATLLKFLTELKKKFAVGKGGEAAFKILPDGSFFNAYANAIDTFKNIEEAIAASGANGKPMTAGSLGKRGDTAGSAERAASIDSAEAAAPVKKNVFRIGINCDAE